jgi:hypothetical protein
MAFSQEVYLDYFNFEKPLVKKTEIIQKFTFYDIYDNKGFGKGNKEEAKIFA